MICDAVQDAAPGSDIFLEQLYTCGAFGFNEFFKESWLSAAVT